MCSGQGAEEWWLSWENYSARLQVGVEAWNPSTKGSV